METIEGNGLNDGVSRAHSKMIVTAAALLAAVPTGASALTLPGGGGVAPAIDAIDMTEQAQFYVYSGRRYCFYPEGWHGPGWYRCGFAWRRGLGWGGVYGWNNWRHGAYERRYGVTTGSAATGARAAAIDAKARRVPSGDRMAATCGAAIAGRRRAAPWVQDRVAAAMAVTAEACADKAEAAVRLAWVAADVGRRRRRR